MPSYKNGYDYEVQISVIGGPFAGYKGKVVGCGKDCLLATLEGRTNIALVQYTDVEKIRGSV